MAQAHRALAIVTGASGGIGYELAKICARQGYDLVIGSGFVLRTANDLDVRAVSGAGRFSARSRR